MNYVVNIWNIIIQILQVSALGSDAMFIALLKVLYLSQVGVFYFP